MSEARAAGARAASITARCQPYVIALGNEKGGSGKSTCAMHLIVGLMRDGFRVGAIDLDARQATLAGYVAARAAFVRARGIDLPVPHAIAVHRSDLDSRVAADAEEASRFNDALGELAACEIIVIDCPGFDTFLSRLGHSHADTLITPINDSFVDFAMLAKVDPDSLKVIHPTVYSEMV